MSVSSFPQVCNRSVRRLVRRCAIGPLALCAAPLCISCASGDPPIAKGDSGPFINVVTYPTSGFFENGLILGSVPIERVATPRAEQLILVYAAHESGVEYVEADATQGSGTIFSARLDYTNDPASMVKQRVTLKAHDGVQPNDQAGDPLVMAVGDPGSTPVTLKVKARTKGTHQESVVTVTFRAIADPEIISFGMASGQCGSPTKVQWLTRNATSVMLRDITSPAHPVPVATTTDASGNGSALTGDICGSDQMLELTAENAVSPGVVKRVRIPGWSGFVDLPDCSELQWSYCSGQMLTCDQWIPSVDRTWTEGGLRTHCYFSGIRRRPARPTPPGDTVR